MARFRLRACGLKNRKQWFVDGEQGDSTCPTCGHGREDEVHLIFRCQTYADFRSKYNIFDSVPSEPIMNDVTVLLSSKDETTIKSVAKYLTETMNLRRKLISSCD